VRRALIILAVLVLLLVIADRVAAAVANRAVADQIRSELALQQKPDVSIHGFPFLLQALRGRYSDVHVKIADVDAGALKNLDVDARLRGVRAPLSGLIGRDLQSIPVDNVTGTLAVSYDDLARASGIPGMTIRAEGNELRVSGTVQVLGRSVPASARGRIEVRNDDLIITADHAEVAGVELPPSALAAAARLLTFRVSPRNLPLALRITSVKVGSDALAVSARAQDVVLRRGALPVG
jgi:LmeA-like phospholipid-binding